MISTRVLIVEPDHPFGLSLASLFQDDGCATRVAGSAGEAEMEIATRRPDLVVLRAELPDLSGFSLCARLRHHASTARLPIILYSSETAPASLAEHARTPWAANGYLAMPLDTGVLRSLARRILSAEPEVESADDAVIEEAELLPQAPPLPHSETRPELPAGTPPPVPRRALRDSLTEGDRLFVERTFQSIADRRDALLAEAQRNRPPPRRDLLQTADGRMQLLRDDLKAREAQIARLAEIWEIREREVSYAGEWLHEKDVELQGLKGQVEDLSGRLAEARELAAEKERQHGALIDALLLEKATQEKELIEQVAGAERRLHDAERRHETAWRAIEERLAAVESERRDLAERLAAVEGERGAMEVRAASLAASLAAEGARATAIEAELGEVRSAAEAASAEAARRAEELQADVAERDRVLAAAKRENDRLQAELTSARHEYMVSESEAQVARERAEKADELAQQLEQALRARDGALPSEPSPTEPSPTEPSPTEPPPTEPSPTEPSPTEPSPTNTAETGAAAVAPAGGPDEARGVGEPAGPSPAPATGGKE